MGLLLVAPPDDQPLTTADLLAHLKELDSSQSDYVASLGLAAMQHFEERTGRALLTQQWQATFDRFPCERYLALPRPPLQTIDLVEYQDSVGVWTTWASSNYTADLTEQQGRLVLAYGASWPSVWGVPNAVRVSFTAGYGDPEDVPEPIRHALRLIVGHWYEHREPVLTGTIQSQLPMGAEALLSGYVVSWL